MTPTVMLVLVHSQIPPSPSPPQGDPSYGGCPSTSMSAVGGEPPHNNEQFATNGIPLLTDDVLCSPKQKGYFSLLASLSPGDSPCIFCDKNRSVHTKSPFTMWLIHIVFSREERQPLLSPPPPPLFCIIHHLLVKHLAHPRQTPLQASNPFIQTLFIMSKRFGFPPLSY